MKKTSLLGLFPFLFCFSGLPSQAFTPWTLGESGQDYSTTDRGSPSTPRVFDKAFSPFLGDKQVKWLSQRNIKSGGVTGNVLTFGFDPESYPASPWFVNLFTNGSAVATAGSFRFRMRIRKDQDGLGLCTTTSYCNKTFDNAFFAATSSGSGTVANAQVKIYRAVGDAPGALLSTIANGGSDSLSPDYPTDIIVDDSWTSMTSGASTLEMSVNQTVPAPLSVLAGPAVFASVARLRRLSSRLKKKP